MQSVLELVTVLVFAAHLLAVNVAMAGPLFCVWLQWRGLRRHDAVAREADCSLAACSLLALAAGVMLGGALLGLLWARGDAPYFAAVRTLPYDRLAFAASELVFSVICMSVYYALAVRGGRKPWLGRLLAIASASNLMYHFPTLFAMLTVISNRPELWQETFDRRLHRSLLLEPEVVSRVLHVWLAAIATAGVVLMLLVTRRIADASTQQNEGQLARRLAAAGAGCALVASLAQIPVGLWLLLELPGNQSGALWGGDIAVLLMLGGSVGLAMFLLHQLAGVALGNTDLTSIRRSAATLAVVVLLMSGTVDRLKRLSALTVTQVGNSNVQDVEIPKAIPGGARAQRAAPMAAS